MHKVRFRESGQNMLHTNGLKSLIIIQNRPFFLKKDFVGKESILSQDDDPFDRHCSQCTLLDRFEIRRGSRCSILFKAFNSTLNC